MEPLGTITKYYPFIDGKARTSIEDYVSGASSYIDFVDKFSHYAYENEVSETLAYIASVHAWRLNSRSAMNRISERYDGYPVIRAWTLNLHKLPYDKMIAEFESIINAVKHDWMLAEILLLRTWLGRYISPHIETEENIELIRSHLRERKDLECFASSFHALECDWHLLHGNLEQANESFEKAMEIARRYDNQYQIFTLISEYTSWSRTFDARKALRVQEKAYQIALSFEAPQLIADATADMGRICETLGEYDLAIRSYQKSMETVEGNPSAFSALSLSRVYCELGDGRRALDWSDTAFELAGPRAFDTPIMLSQRAEALVMVGQIDEAAQYLDLCHKVSLKSGRKGHLATSGLANGYFELAHNDPLTAIQTMEPCLDLLQQIPASIYINRF
ncbi:MAG: hypothetical protein P1Q69_21025, partial [Candidatus Thorarchaeota archaeon]|nr:hypothetical protein [Candidatus Thorarchaeota archaeon]